MENFKITDYAFERTVWANMQLSKLCPGGNISNFTKILEDEDTSKQLNSMIDIALILNEAAEKKACFLDSTHEKKLLSRELLLNLDIFYYHKDINHNIPLETLFYNLEEVLLQVYFLK